jgi:hypothetical protein
VPNACRSLQHLFSVCAAYGPALARTCTSFFCGVLPQHLLWPMPAEHWMISTPSCVGTECVDPVGKEMAPGPDPWPAVSRRAAKVRSLAAVAP